MVACPHCGAGVQIDPAPGQTVRQFHSKIVGVTKPNPDGSDRQAIIARCQVGESLLLVREPDNRFDPDAVAVRRTNGEQLGYLSADLADEMARLLDRGERIEVQISDLTGGGRKARGVNIRITRYV
jgi:hypothetical protein